MQSLDTRQSVVTLERLAFLALTASVGAMAFSLPLGRVLLATSAVLVAVECARSRFRLLVPASAWFALAYVLITVVATLRGVNPDLGLRRLPKLIWFMGLPLAATLVTSPGRLRILVRAYAIGAGVLAWRIFSEHPGKAVARIRQGRVSDFMSGLVDVGSMTDGQRLMVGLVLTLGLVLAAHAGRRQVRDRWILLLGFLGAGLLANFKRGSWLCGAAAMAALLGLRAGWKTLALVVLVGLGALTLPPVRARLAGLQAEVADQGGGRMMMWRDIAPRLLDEHPGGIGYRSLTNDMMRDIAPAIEPDRDHLHSNPIQIAVESGWLGLVVWLLWMAQGLCDAVRGFRRARADRELAAVMLALLIALISLLLNGLVEYNMGDAEIVLAYGVLLGCGAAAAKFAVAPATAPSRPATAAFSR